MHIYREKQGADYLFKVIYDEEVEYIELDDEMMDKYEGVKDAFGDLYWDRTVVTKQGVSFYEEGNHYAFVYTFDGKKPNYENSKVKYLKDRCFMFVRKLF